MIILYNSTNIYRCICVRVPMSAKEREWPRVCDIMFVHIVPNISVHVCDYVKIQGITKASIWRIPAFDSSVMLSSRAS